MTNSRPEPPVGWARYVIVMQTLRWITLAEFSGRQKAAIGSRLREVTCLQQGVHMQIVAPKPLAPDRTSRQITWGLESIHQSRRQISVDIHRVRVPSKCRLSELENVSSRTGRRESYFNVKQRDPSGYCCYAPGGKDLLAPFGS